MSTETPPMLRMGELAEASGVPVPTIKHYLREGLLPEPVKTSRNMAYYPPEFVERLKANFTEREIVILASTAAQVNYWARLIQALGVPPMGVSDQCELPKPPLAA